MRHTATILVAFAAMAAGTAFTFALAPKGAPLTGAPRGAVTSGGDGAEPFRSRREVARFRLELAEGTGVDSAAAEVVVGDGAITVVTYPQGSQWRQTSSETAFTSTDVGYTERARLSGGLPRWLLVGLYPTNRTALQELVEGRAGVGGLGPYVDWESVEAAVGSGLATWLPRSHVCGHLATGIRIPRQHVYPGVLGGEYRVWFDRSRSLRLQNEEVVDGTTIYGRWCRRYVTGADVDLSELTHVPTIDSALPETVVSVVPTKLADAGTFPSGLRPSGAYRVRRTWSGPPPDRMPPAGTLTVLVIERTGEEPAYVVSADPPGSRPLRMEWLHEAALWAKERQDSASLSAPTLLGSWANESGLQGAVWRADGREWTFVGPPATLGSLSASIGNE